MSEAATALHTLFVSYIAAGFSVDQALRLIAYTLAAYQGGTTPPKDSDPQ
jgi:hypothetical protein